MVCFPALYIDGPSPTNEVRTIKMESNNHQLNNSQQSNDFFNLPSLYDATLDLAI